MALSTSSVILYAADVADYAIALGAAGLAGIRSGNVVVDFETAWNDVASGNFLVIAIGGQANAALYYNPCGWANPAGDPAGTTPFVYQDGPLDTLPGTNYYENAAGSDAEASSKLAAMLAYYAVRGSYPAGYGTLPSATSPTTSCPSNAVNNQTCPC